MVPNSQDLSGVKSIRAFLKEKHPDSSSDLGIKPEVLDTYVRSCAGYAVITYLLGIGDRHLNNIMLDVSIGREGMIDRIHGLKSGKTLKVMRGHTR